MAHRNVRHAFATALRNGNRIQRARRIQRSRRSRRHAIAVILLSA